MKKLKLLGILLVSNTFAMSGVYAQELFLEKVTILDKKYKPTIQDSISLKSKKNIKYIPASIQSINSNTFDTQGLVNLQQLTVQFSSLQTKGWDYGVGDQMEIRGQSVSYTKDGLSNNDFGSENADGFSPVRTLTNAQSVQLVKGANSSLYGAGGIGGMLNITSKNPLNSDNNRVRMTVGSYRTYGTLLDYTKKYNEMISGRVVANFYNSQGYRKINDNKMELYPSISVKGSAGTLIVSGEISQTENHFDSIGHPVRFNKKFGTLNYNDVSGSSLTSKQKDEVRKTIDKDTGGKIEDAGDNVLTGGILSPAKTENGGSSFQYTHNIKGWNIKQSGQAKVTKQNYVRLAGAYNYTNYGGSGKENVNPRSPLVISGIVYPYALRRAEYRRRNFKETAFDYSVDFKKTLKNHEVLIVAGLKNQELNVRQYSVYDKDTGGADNKNPAPYIKDYRNPKLPDKIFEEYTSFAKDQYTKQNNTYFIGVNDVLDIDDRLIVRGGMSVLYYSQKRNNYSCYDRTTKKYTSDCSRTSASDIGRTLNLGATYKIDSKMNMFTGYAYGKTPHNVAGNTEDSADVMRIAENKEFGIKYSLPNDGLLTATAFTTGKTNQEYSWDTGKKDASNNPILKPKYNKSYETSGWEVDFSYNPTDNSFISIAYANSVTRTYQAEAGTGIMKSSNTLDGRGMAEQSFNIFGSYILPGKINPIKSAKIMVFGNVKHIGKRDLYGYGWFNGATGVDKGGLYIPPSTIIDIGTRVDIYNSWSTVFKVNNVLNSTYYARRLFAGALPGAKRNFMLTIEKTF